MGYNDSIGTLLALAAFLVRGRSALLAGLLVGCSMSCKLMPGLVAATIVFPPDRWKSYAAGMAVGLLPTVLFLAWDPDAFIRNVLLFNLVRSPDGTSWRLFAPAWLGRVASLGALGFWLAGSAWLAWRSRNANSSTGAEGCPVRLALFVAVTLGLIMTGSTAHDDYMIWWMPAVLAILPLEIGLGRRTAQGAGRDARAPGRSFTPRPFHAFSNESGTGLSQAAGSGAARHAIDEPVFQRDPPRPPPFEIALQRLGFAGPLEGIALAFPDEVIDPLKDVGCRRLPVKVIFPRSIGEHQFHGSSRTRVCPVPASSWRTASLRRRVFASEESRCNVSSIAFQSARETMTTDSAFCREITTGVWSAITRSITCLRRARVSE
jgi:hypothetical protein